VADVEALQRQDLAAREFPVPVGARTYTVRMPTEREFALALKRCRRDQPRAALLEEYARELLLIAVVGWEGLKAGDLVKGLPKPDEPVSFSRAAVGFVLDKLPEDALAIGEAFNKRMEEREQAIEAAEKN
jgi:hypothetical protein